MEESVKNQNFVCLFGSKEDSMQEVLHTSHLTLQRESAFL